MIKVTPSQIHRNRVYFTEFDRSTYSQVERTSFEVHEFKRNLERKLKLLALVKGHIVVAASHLIESELAHEILLPHPRLFSDGLLIPALRSEFDSIQQFVDAKIDENREADFYLGDRRAEMVKMVDSAAKLVLTWDVRAAGQWFRERLIQDLSNKGSVVRLAAPAGFDGWEKLIDLIKEYPSVNRNSIYVLGRDSGDNRLWDLICKWTDFNYYLSGAVAVGSEGVLPQENLMDFNVTDLADGRTSLSDMQVFFKLFVDLVKQATQAHFPVDVLDALTIEDVLDLHKIAVSDRFVDKYNQIQEHTKAGLEIQDPARLVLLMDELQQFEQDLKNCYRSAIQQELPGYRRAKKTLEIHKTVSAVASVVVPYYGTNDTAKELILSGLRVLNKSTWADHLEKGLDSKMSALERFVDRRPAAEKPTLLDFVNKIKKIYSRNMDF